MPHHFLVVYKPLTAAINAQGDFASQITSITKRGQAQGAEDHSIAITKANWQTTYATPGSSYQFGNYGASQPADSFNSDHSNNPANKNNWNSDVANIDPPVRQALTALISGNVMSLTPMVFDAEKIEVAPPLNVPQGSSYLVIGSNKDKFGAPAVGITIWCPG